MNRVIAYVDGFNLYFGLRDRGWLVPKVGAKASPAPKDIELIPVNTLREAISMGLVGRRE